MSPARALQGGDAGTHHGHLTVAVPVVGPRPIPDPSAASLSETPTARFRLHHALVDHLRPGGGDVLLDLGCGSGITLAVACDRVPHVRVLGVDVDAGALRAAAGWLDRLQARHQLVQADLSEPLPLAEASATRVVCHDVLECIPDPRSLLVEACRVMRPGSTSVWSHVDYESTVISGGDPELTRRVVRAYAACPQAGTQHCDGQMGRRLPALVRQSPLLLTDVTSHVMLSTQLAGPARMRVEDIATRLRRASRDGGAQLTTAELDDWQASLHAADRSDEFFFAQTAYVVVAIRPK